MFLLQGTQQNPHALAVVFTCPLHRFFNESSQGLKNAGNDCSHELSLQISLVCLCLFILFSNPPILTSVNVGLELSIGDWQA